MIKGFSNQTKPNPLFSTVLIALWLLVRPWFPTSHFPQIQLGVHQRQWVLRQRPDLFVSVTEDLAEVHNIRYQLSAFKCQPLASCAEIGTSWEKDCIKEGPFPIKFNRATLPFLKIDMRHQASRHETNYFWHNMDDFLKSTCDIGLFWKSTWS